MFKTLEINAHTFKTTQKRAAQRIITPAHESTAKELPMAAHKIAATNKVFLESILHALLFTTRNFNEILKLSEE
jgi:hypothetical protein